jgi:hypothetical protein
MPEGPFRARKTSGEFFFYFFFIRAAIMRYKPDIIIVRKSLWRQTNMYCQLIHKWCLSFPWEMHGRIYPLVSLRICLAWHLLGCGDQLYREKKKTPDHAPIVLRIRRVYWGSQLSFGGVNPYFVFQNLFFLTRLRWGHGDAWRKKQKLFFENFLGRPS